jgi:hypothetical protein
MIRILRRLATLGAAAALLSGCAGGYLLDNTVQSFSGLPTLPASPTYRFDRLPSQAASPNQDAIEALADPALFKVGLQRNDASPRYSVQVSARVQRVLSPYADPWDPGWGWGSMGWGGRHTALGFGWGGPFPRMEQPWYQREVGVVVRELAGNKVVFESHAANDGPFVDNNVALAAMFDAALQGFPNPPPGPRRVDIQIGGKTQAASADAPAAANGPAPPAVR